MRGSSGAHLAYSGDTLTKTCADSDDQVAWFSLASDIALVRGVALPHVSRISDVSYKVQLIEGRLLTHVTSVGPISMLLDQVYTWSKVPPESDGDWDSYLMRLEDHASVSQSKVMSRAMAFVESAEPFTTSFCHGDLTLENAIFDASGQVFLIDPNFKRGLFQSYMLDLGKLMQSVHADYHKLFSSNHGIDLTRHCEFLVKELETRGDLEAALVAEISHVMRLRKYRPLEQRSTVDELLERLLKR